MLGAPYLAFATNGQGAWGMAQAAFDQPLADSDALDRCKKSPGGNNGCAVVARTPGLK